MDDGPIISIGSVVVDDEVYLRGDDLLTTLATVRRLIETHVGDAHDREFADGLIGALEGDIATVLRMATDE